MVLAKNLKSTEQEEVSKAPFCVTVRFCTDCRRKPTDPDIEFSRMKT